MRIKQYKRLRTFNEADADASATVADIMEETKVIIESLVKKIGELADANKELREQNARLLREIEGMKPYVTKTKE